MFDVCKLYVFRLHHRSLLVLTTGAGTNLKVGVHVRRESPIFVVPPLFLALQVQLVVFVSAFVMVSTVWSVSFYCSFTHGAP